MIFLEAKGHAVDAIKAARWSDHPLGYSENWSSALRSNLYTILNSAAPKMLLWSDDLIVFFNDAYLKLTDGSDCSGLGASYPLLRPELWTSLQGSIEAALSGHGSITSEFRATAETTGSWSGVYQLCFSPVLDEQRIISGVLIDFVDLTVRKAREDKLSGEVELLTQLFRTTPVLISYCTGPELRIDYMNDALRRLFEGRPLVGSRLADAIPEVAEQGHLNRILEVLGSGVPWGAYELPLLIRSCEGTGEAWHYFDFACHPVTATGGSVAGLLFSGYDVTEHRAAREESKRLRHQLLHATRTEAMGTMAATIAHELNQPIAAAINYLAVAECNIERSGRDADRDASEAVTAASDQMIRAGLIIRRMRSLVESGTPKSEPFDLVQSIERATDVLRASGDLEGFAVRVDPRPNARCGLGDEIQIEQVIVNILRNAARASTQCACREAVITCRRRGNMIEVSVRDRGPGVSPQLLEKLFVTMQSSSPEGLGVGLSLCRTIVEAHGGTIVARNEPSGGAVFAFTLPAAADGRLEAP